MKRLGIEYLWIDALCIIQEGDGGRDWAEQASQMTTIYESGTLNISVLDGVDSSAGLRPQKLNRYGIHVGTTTQYITGQVGDILLLHSQCYDLLNTENRPLSKRGWAFQECLVSPATIHFTNCGMI